MSQQGRADRLDRRVSAFWLKCRRRTVRPIQPMIDSDGAARTIAGVPGDQYAVARFADHEAKSV